MNDSLHFRTIEDEYRLQTLNLYYWFMEWMPQCEPIELTTKQISNGLSALPECSLKVIHELAFELWLKEKEYELSYQQLCLAFYLAARDSGKIIII